MPKDAKQAVVVLDKEVTLAKSTKGTHVVANEDAGLSFYLPKPFFEAAGLTPAVGDKFRVVITPIVQE